ncbi:MAG: glycosyltransferase family 4 protein [Pirellulales bacterium]
MSVALATQSQNNRTSRVKLPLHAVLVTNFIPPYMKPIYIELSRRVRKLTILVSTPMESNRQWKPDWEGLDVRLQRGISIKRPWRHDVGFSELWDVHIPWNTVGELRRQRPDVVITTQFGCRSLLSALYTHFCRKTPLVILTNMSGHTEKHWGRHRTYLRKWFAGQAEVVTINGMSGARYLESLGFPRENIHYFPYAALPELTDSAPKTRDVEVAHRLISVGQLSQRKGIVPFLQALGRWAARHPEKKIEYALAGLGPELSCLQQLARELSENVHVEFLGERTYQELAQDFAASGIMAFPTLADEWGLVVNEAMSAGLPVLGSQYSQAVSDLCVEGQTGWIFRPDSVDETEQAIERAFSTSVEQLNTMRHAAQQRVNHLTPAFAADCLLDAIRLAYRRKVGDATYSDLPEMVDLWRTDVTAHAAELARRNASHLPDEMEEKSRDDDATCLLAMGTER